MITYCDSSSLDKWSYSWWRCLRNHTIWIIFENSCWDINSSDVKRDYCDGLLPGDDINKMVKKKPPNPSSTHRNTDLTIQVLSSFVSNPENMLRSSCTPDKHETRDIKAWWSAKKFPSTWLLPGDGKRRVKHVPNILACVGTERGLPKGLASVVPESKHWKEMVPSWGWLKIKFMVWTSTHSLAIVSPQPLAQCGMKRRKPRLFPEGGSSWNMTPTFCPFGGLSRDCFLSWLS